MIRHDITTDGDVLSRLSPLALHEQLAARLRELAGRAGNGSRLPTETELVKTFNVSRSTVRRALDTLAQEGILMRRQGRGTFVTAPQVVQSLDRLAPFVQAFAESDSIETRLAEFKWITGEVPEEIGGPEAEALRFERLYLTDGTPHALVRGHLPTEVGSRITRAVLESHPIYHVLQNELGLALREARFTVGCRPASGDVAELLEISEGEPLLITERVTIGEEGGTVELATHYLLPEVYRLRVTVRGAEIPPLIQLPKNPDDGEGEEDRAGNN